MKKKYKNFWVTVKEMLRSTLIVLNVSKKYQQERQKKNSQTPKQQLGINNQSQSRINTMKTYGDILFAQLKLA